MRILLLAVTIVVAGLVGVSSTGADNGQLVGSVGPGFGISLKDSSGVAVTHLATGPTPCSSMICPRSTTSTSPAPAST